MFAHCSVEEGDADEEAEWIVPEPFLEESEAGTAEGRERDTRHNSGL